jgi:hypothetical protein
MLARQGQTAQLVQLTEQLSKGICYYNLAATGDKLL